MKTIKTLWKSTPKINFIIYIFFVFAILGCNKDDGPEPTAIVETTPIEEIQLSDEKQITSFVFLLTNNPIEVNIVATIDEENKTITATMPPGTNITGLLPEVKTSTLSTIDHDTVQNFTESLEYTVTAEDGSTNVYTVTLTTLLSQRQILQAILDANPNNTLGWDLNTTENLGDFVGVTLNTENEIIELLLADKGISILPPEIGLLTTLEKLNLFMSGLTSLPPEIGQLINLGILSIGRNQLTSLPAEIGQLIKLEGLDLQSNKLTSLPAEIGQLISLNNLALDVNQLTSLPLEIGQLISLKRLILFNNKLTSLPIEIGQLTRLEELSLTANQLTALPTEIGQLINLHRLNLNQNQLTSLPAEIGQLTRLESLSLAANELTSIPIEIGLLRLGNLNLTDNQLTSLPPEIGQLTQLDILNLNGNQLTSLPPEIGFLTKLRELWLTENNLTTIPQAICNLKNFRPFDPSALTIFMGDNVTCSTTSQKDALISIYTDNPSNTLLWGVDNYPGVNFNENGNPIAITANNKNLSRIPDTIDQLDKLGNLAVNNNNLESLPATLGNINALTIIAAASNNLSTIPSELGQLTNLALLSLTNNPITSIPQEVCDLQTSNGGILTLLTDPGEGCNQ